MRLRCHRANFIPSGPPTAMQAEPTLQELLTDPIITAVMDADRVNRSEFESMLRWVQALLKSRRERAHRFYSRRSK
jgi:hypothetical protein